MDLVHGGLPESFTVISTSNITLRDEGLCTHTLMTYHHPHYWKKTLTVLESCAEAVKNCWERWVIGV